MQGPNGRRVGRKEPAMCPLLRVSTSRNREKKGAGDKWDNKKALRWRYREHVNLALCKYFALEV